MAELLIRATDTVLADTEKASRRAYRAGDPVLAMLDGHVWGRNELYSPDNGRALFVLKIPDLAVSQCQKYLAEYWDDLFLTQQAKRRYRFVLSEFPPPFQNDVNARGFAQFNWGQVRGLIEDKRTGLREAL